MEGIRISESGDVLEQALVLSSNARQIVRDGRALVARARKVVRKPATGEAHRYLGANARRATNGRDERTYQKKAASPQSQNGVRHQKSGEKSALQVAGKAGSNWTRFVPSFVLQSPPPTPKSPLEKKTLEPRVPSCANRLHTLVA